MSAGIDARGIVQGMDLSESLGSGAPAPLPHAALVRRLLPSLHRLRSLSALNLAGNLFTRVPAALGQLSALEFLDMSCNPELQARLRCHVSALPAGHIGKA